MPKYLEETERVIIVHLYREGLSYKYISRQTGQTTPTVRYIVKRYKKKGMLSACSNSKKFCVKMAHIHTGFILIKIFLSLPEIISPMTTLLYFLSFVKLVKISPS